MPKRAMVLAMVIVCTALFDYLTLVGPSPRLHSLAPIRSTRGLGEKWRESSAPIAPNPGDGIQKQRALVFALFAFLGLCLRSGVQWAEDGRSFRLFDALLSTGSARRPCDPSLTFGLRVHCRCACLITYFKLVLEGT